MVFRKICSADQPQHATCQPPQSDTTNYSWGRRAHWSGRRDSNPRPQPWQGCALPLSYTRILTGSGPCRPPLLCQKGKRKATGSRGSSVAVRSSLLLTANGPSADTFQLTGRLGATQGTVKQEAGRDLRWRLGDTTV